MSYYLSKTVQVNFTEALVNFHKGEKAKKKRDGFIF